MRIDLHNLLDKVSLDDCKILRIAPAYNLEICFLNGIALRAWMSVNSVHCYGHGMICFSCRYATSAEQVQSLRNFNPWPECTSYLYVKPNLRSLTKFLSEVGEIPC